jgi:hypothetical protein
MDELGLPPSHLRQDSHFTARRMEALPLLHPDQSPRARVAVVRQAARRGLVVALGAGDAGV